MNISLRPSRRLAEAEGWSRSSHRASCSSFCSPCFASSFIAAPERRLHLRMLILRQMTQHVAELVVAATLEPVNRKLIERLYREEGLTLKRKKPKRRRSAVRRERSTPAASVNERWAMDFVPRYAVQQPDGAGADGSGCVQQGVGGT